MNILDTKMISKLLRRRYILALSIIAVLVLLSQALVQYTINNQQDDSRIVNIAGRQRMLSQRIVKCSLIIQSALPDNEKNRYRKELVSALVIWRQSHKGLQVGDAELGLPGGNNKQISDMFKKIEPQFQTIVLAAELIASEDASNDKSQAALLTILHNQADFLQGMDEIVFQYDADAKGKIATTKQIEIGILVVTFLTLLLEALLIFRPAEKNVQNSFAECKQSEASLNRLFDMNPTPMVMLDDDDKLVRINNAATKFLKISQAADNAKKMTDFFTLEPQDEVVWHQVLSHDSVVGAELAMRLGDDDVIVMVSTTRIKFEGVPHMIVCLVDITAQKRAAQEIKAANYLLEENALRANALALQAKAANTAKSQFLANMSHEIRTPMNGVMGFLDLLNRSNLSIEQKDFISEAKTASELLMHIINDILDFSKIEAGKLLIEKTNFKIRTTIQEAISLLVPKALEKNIELHTIINADVPEEFIGDPARLSQILNNLISNAVKFTQNGEVFVTVECIREEEGNGLLKFAVVDTGIGIDEADINKLFQAFNQADETTTRKYGGTGLGLAISKQLVEMMKGSISVDSKPGVGSTFSFTVSLPIVVQAPSVEKSVLELKVEDIHKPIVPQDKVQEVKSVIKPKILLVEDNDINRKIIITMFKSRDLDCDVALDGSEALKAVIEKDYDIVLMDCQMPVMDGYESTKAIRQMEGTTKHTTIIAMTANAMIGDRDKCIAAGMDDYICKPIDFEAMFKLIEENINKRVLSDEDPVWVESYIESFINASGLSIEDVQELFTTYIKYIPKVLAEIKEAIAQQDFEKIKEIAHKLKGSSGNLRITAIYELAMELEEGAIQQKKVTCQSVFEKIEKMFS